MTTDTICGEVGLSVRSRHDCVTTDLELPGQLVFGGRFCRIVTRKSQDRCLMTFRFLASKFALSTARVALSISTAKEASEP
jgi:hypothetical protein